MGLRRCRWVELVVVGRGEGSLGSEGEVRVGSSQLELDYDCGTKRKRCEIRTELGVERPDTISTTRSNGIAS